MKKLFIILSIFTLAMLTSCKKEQEEPDPTLFNTIIENIGEVQYLDTEYPDNSEGNYAIGYADMAMVIDETVNVIYFQDGIAVMIEIEYEKRLLSDTIKIISMNIDYMDSIRKIYVNVLFHKKNKQSFGIDMTDKEFANYVSTLNVNHIHKILLEAKLLDKK